MKSLLITPLVCFLLAIISHPSCEARHYGRIDFARRRLPIVLLPRGGTDGDESNAGIKHEIVEEKLLFHRWRTLTSRLVRFPDGREVDFDVSGSPKDGQHVTRRFVCL